LVFLERDESTVFEMTPMTCSQARSQIEHDLLAESSEALRVQEETLEQLLSVPSVVLRYGGRPQQVAEQLAVSFFDKIR
jgi:hypothetical protein